MSTENEEHVSGDFNFYGPQYARFGTALAAELRREVYGEEWVCTSHILWLGVVCGHG